MNNRTSEPTSAPSAPSAAASAASGAQALRALDLEAYLADPARKQSFVTPMFDVIAPRYDDFTRVFSFGMDARWKAEVIREVVQALESNARPDPLVLDLACGTGDLAIGVARAIRAGRPDVRVLGVDASREMTRLAGARLRGSDRDVSRQVHVSTGDMSRLAAADGSVDVITAGYGVRNAPDPVLAIEEAARVLRSGGLYVTLDFYRPEAWAWRVALLGYLRAAGNLVGWAWHRSPVVYGYIAPSIDHFMSWQAFSRTLNEHGFRTRSVRRWLAGGVALHVAERV